ncbi:GFA family protein [Pleomorphomonas koreensis]|uniref:GFA family protein n=1 Tax=Pleomorphomonas koreensis TaxID=257440 RepID=UPI00040DFF68|nr:GFA family protein [Pleomorphomonas koreensis]
MTILTGGCQCGAIRFACDSDKVGQSSVCHCRMCQKAVGNYSAPYVSFRPGAVTWTRGARKLYRSSNLASRGFCGDCGTPLTFEFEGCEPSIAGGAFDDPAALPPTLQCGVEGMLPFVDGIAALPREETGDVAAEAGSAEPLRSYQHPDHDTAVWPLPKA